MSLVLCMDPTHGTNRFNMPLLLISSIDPFGQSYIVTCCLLEDETAVSYNIALSSFKQLFEPRESNVEVIITDQSLSLMSAIDVQFPNAIHQLCRWHLEMNVKKTLSETLISAKFTRFMRCEDELVALQMYEDMINNASPDETSYLERLYSLRHKYVEVWTSGYSNFGTRSTQRAESMNGSFKQHLETQGPLVDLFHALRKMTKSYEETVAFLEFQLRDHPRMYVSLISSMVGRVSKLILDLVNSEFSSTNHLVYQVEGECAVFNDAHQCSIEQGCDCPFFSQYSAPCAHCFCVHEGGCVESLLPILGC